ncbi:MAG: hypothetical protein QE269_08070 [Fimbriimonas sp.]|nr:hypothetical protein [Fimbriimonas sp.]
MAKGKKVLAGCGVFMILGGAAAWFSPAGDAVRDLLKTGILEKNEANAKFEGDSITHLKALHVAAEVYHQSEEKFPEAVSWMDDLMPRLKTGDLAQGEAEKKLVRPDLQGKSGSYGYAINLAVAGKYRGDIKDEKAILFFESTNTRSNWADDPKTGALPGGKAITIKGEIVTLPN